jgi:hypothetical protein
MAARAFSAYVEDKVAEQGNRSDFLAYGSDNKFYRLFGIQPFPEGAEREAINAAFDKFMGEVKTAETDKGTAMFSRQSRNLDALKFKQQTDKRGMPIFHNAEIGFARGEASRRGTTPARNSVRRARCAFASSTRRSATRTANRSAWAGSISDVERPIPEHPLHPDRQRIPPGATATGRRRSPRCSPRTSPPARHRHPRHRGGAGRSGRAQASPWSTPAASGRRWAWNS